MIYTVDISTKLPVIADSKEAAEKIAKQIVTGTHAQSDAWDESTFDVNGSITAVQLEDISTLEGWDTGDIPFGDFEDDLNIGDQLATDKTSEGNS